MYKRQDLLERPLAFAPGAAVFDSAWPLGDLWQCRDKADEEIALEAVSYTHLTLPTSDLV